MSGRVANLIVRLKTVPWLQFPAEVREPEPYLTEWKHYYQLLRISPEADEPTVASAYWRLTRLYYKLLSQKTQETEFFAARMADTDEAYGVLSSKTRRAAYDRVLREKAIPYEPPVKDEIDRLVTLVSEQMTADDGRNWRFLQWSRAIRQAVLIAVLVIVLVMAGGSSLAFARSESPLAAPFRSVVSTIATIAGTSAEAIGLIDDVYGVAASFERSVISTAVQSMRVTEGIEDVPVVTVPTNDMSIFPSKEHCLFPDYVDRQYSQFKYTVDSNGIVTVDTSGATTDALLKKIEGLLRRLEAE